MRRSRSVRIDLSRVRRAVLAAAMVSAGTGAAPAPPLTLIDVLLAYGTDGYVADFSFEGTKTKPERIDTSKVRISLVDTRQHVVLGPEHFHAGQPRRIPSTGPGVPDRLEVFYRVDAPFPQLGMYALHVIANPGAFALDDAAVRLRADPLNVYAGPTPERPPALVPGQRFLDSAPVASAPFPSQAENTEPPLVDDAGRPLPRAQIGLRPLTLDRIDTSVSPHRLTFRLAGARRVSLSSDADVSHLPGLVPIVTDPETTALEKEYTGRAVWTIGARSLRCINSAREIVADNFDGDSKLIVDHIYRTGAFPTFFSRIGETDGFEMSSAFWDAAPIVVALKRTSESHVAGGSALSDGLKNGVFELGLGCDGFAARFAGRWDFDRAFSRQSLKAQSRGWSAEMVDYVKNGEVRVGMTHEMIARMFGYPSIYGSRATLDRLESWPYQRPAPFSSCVYFRGDGVTRYDPPRSMP